MRDDRKVVLKLILLLEQVFVPFSFAILYNGYIEMTPTTITFVACILAVGHLSGMIIVAGIPNNFADSAIA